MKTRIGYPTLLILVVLFSLHGCNKEEIKPVSVINPVSLINNGNVEEGANFPNYWWKNATIPDRYSLVWTDQASYSSKKSLKISSIPESTDNTNFAYWGQTIDGNLLHGKTLTLKVMIKGNLIGQGISIAIRGDDTLSPSGYAEQFSTTQSILSISNTFDWKEYSVTLNNVNSSIQSITIYLVFLPNTTGEVYFDDISMTAI